MKKLILTLSALALAACQSDYIPDKPSKDRALVTVIDKWVIDPPLVIDPLPLVVLPVPESVKVIAPPPVIGGGPKLGDLPMLPPPPPESVDVPPVIGGGPELGGL
jgi:hypothetical protein